MSPLVTYDRQPATTNQPLRLGLLQVAKQRIRWLFEAPFKDFAAKFFKLDAHIGLPDPAGRIIVSRQCLFHL
jgi:hypothetical protein